MGLKYGTINVYLKNGDTIEFESVDVNTIEIDKFDYIHFKRLNHDLTPCKWTTVVMNLKCRALYYEVTED